jgi:aspartate/methionine/tyrosine aminotransferase
VFSSRLAWEEPPNALAIAAARARASGRAFFDLTTSNPTAVGLAYPEAELAAALADGARGPYAPDPLGLPEARAAVAADYARRGARVTPERIALTASSSESYALLLKLLCDPGDTVAVPEPSYPLFEPLARLEGVRLRPYRLRFDGGWHLDFSTFDLAGACAALAVSPNNPTGSYLTRAELRRLAEACAAHDAALVVDEVFADYPLAPAPDAAGAAAAEDLPALCFSLGGLSKSCGLPQLKLGWIAATGPDAQVAAALARLEHACDAYLSVGAPVQRALPHLLAVGAGIRAQIAARVKENHDRLAGALRGSAVSLLPVEAGWAAILRLPAVRSDEDWALELLRRDDVLVQPGYFFDLELPACVVVSLLPVPRVVAEGSTRLCQRVARALG